MRLPAFIAFLALLVSPVGLGTVAQADTPVALTVATVGNAKDFPYGVRQSFQVLGDTKGKKCSFSYSISLNGNWVTGQGPIVAALPWTSDDLRLPTSNGAKYTILVGATNSPANLCTGTATTLFTVVPETGKISGITGPKLVAVNQTFAVQVAGKSFGFCKYNITLTHEGSQVTQAVVKQMPYEYSTSIPAAGDYAVAADEIDDTAGQPDGCSGHVKTYIGVVLRPQCPLASEYYQAPDDSEFGCLLPAGPAIPQPTFFCPTGYNVFGTVNPEQYGCLRQNTAALTFAKVSGMVGNAPVNVVGPVAAVIVPPQTDKPTIVRLQAVAAPPGSAPRPNSNVLYAGEDFRVDVVGNLPNQAGYQANKCGFTIELQDIKTSKVISKAEHETFDIWDVGAVPSPGEYRVLVTPYAHAGTNPACLGKAELSKVTFYPQAAWVTGLKVVGFGYHFNMADAMGMPQFCEACDSVFSPAHNRAFLQMIPTISGSTPGGRCVYSVSEIGNGTEEGQTGVFTNGQASGVPTNQLQFNSPDLISPYWTEWNVNSVTVTVAITPGIGLQVTPCNILGGKFTKTITFTDDPSLKPVVK
jgi:hypothetical protein